MMTAYMIVMLIASVIIVPPFVAWIIFQLIKLFGSWVSYKNRMIEYEMIAKKNNSAEARKNAQLFLDGKL